MSNNETLQLSEYQHLVIEQLGYDSWFINQCESEPNPKKGLNIDDLIHSDINETDDLNLSDTNISKNEITSVSQLLPEIALSNSTQSDIKQDVGINLDTSIINKNHHNTDGFTLHSEYIDFNLDELKKLINISKSQINPMSFTACTASTNDMIVFPPLLSTTSIDVNEDTSHGLKPNELKLISEILLNLGVCFDETYQTRMVKHPVLTSTITDTNIIEQQISILAYETSLIKPKRIWLFGSDTCQFVLNTQQSLSSIMKCQQTIKYSSTENTTNTAQILCLPDLDYLLSLPAEKAQVWKYLKSSQKQNLQSI